VDRKGLRPHARLLTSALLDPYYPRTMVARTLFSDVTGMRFFIRKDRPELEPALARSLLLHAEAFQAIRKDIPRFFDLGTVTGIPLDGLRHPLPDEQWCTLCGECCQIGGVSPRTPQGVELPRHWEPLLSGEYVAMQQFCPFLFQYFGESRFFCSIHNVKPISCRTFGESECRKRLAEGGLHEAPPRRRLA